ncbi:hypothetical protein T10_7156 [Trichinella papuae]|uniref:HTH psq-type domain-containing protein n=1 Tax=Trichinella papuae TaxID=268474 RepID=A0A0V1NA39_9BILA|nr:hypothetical protein T10_7156 [Trichinella papuae]
MDMQRDVTDQVLDVASKRAKCCIAPVPVANRWTIAYRPSAASFFLLLCSGAMFLLMAVIRQLRIKDSILYEQVLRLPSARESMEKFFPKKREKHLPKSNVGECLQATVALRLLLFVLGGAGGLSKWRKKNRAKLRLLRNFRSFKQTVDENPNIDIARMMKIPSSTLNRILAKWKTLESACNDENLSNRKQIQGGKFPELLLITFSLRQIE